MRERPDKDRRVVPYSYQIEFANIAAGDDATENINLGPRDFIWTELSVVTRGTSDDFDLFLRDEGQSRNFMTGLQHVDGHMGDVNNRSRKLPVPWRFGGNTTLVGNAHNNDAANAGTLIVTLHGYLE